MYVCHTHSHVLEVIVLLYHHFMFSAYWADSTNEGPDLKGDQREMN